jgi:inner membrane protein
MPSPIAHLTAGYLVYLSGRHSWRVQSGAKDNTSARRELLIAALSFSMLPDVDSVAGLLLGDFGRYHNNGTHSLLVGAAVSLGFAALVGWRKRQVAFWSVVAAACYSLHILMDAATISRGVMAFWPLSEKRFLSPVPLFYGLHWSNGWLSVRHIWTALTELAFSAAVLAIWTIGSRRHVRA